MVGMDTLGARVREQRIRKGWDQPHLANLAGITPKLVSSVETGRSTPSHRVFVALAHALGVSLDYLALGRDTAPAGSNRDSSHRAAVALLDQLSVAEVRLATRIMEAIVENRVR